MTQAKTKLPLFPLGLSILPGEELPLHIFEPRYKELISDCKSDNITFGIPFIEGSSMSTYGTNVQLTEVTKYYDNGELDILVKGLNVFRIENFYEQLPHKLYAGGDVTFIIQNEYVFDDAVLEQFDKFHTQLHGSAPETFEGLKIYDIARFMDLNSAEKMKLIKMDTPAKKINYLKNQMKWKSLIQEQEKQIIGNIFPN